MALPDTPGRYTATATDAQIGETSNGKPFIQIAFKTEEGFEITGWVYLSEKAIDRAVKTLEEAFGFDGNFESVEEQIKDKKCSIVCDEEENDKGDLVMRVKWINPLGFGVKKMDDEQSWRQKMSARYARRTGGTAAPAQKPAAAPVGNTDTEDDVPF